jgi:riboflavin kinase/FMN adenylyltransferase
MTRRPDSVVTVGTFDGLHRGHKTIIGTVVRLANERGARSVVITFDPHPREVVASSRGPVALLTTLDERLDAMDGLGVSAVYIVRFTPELSRLDAREFYQNEVVGTVGVQEVVIGHDHKFGRDRAAGERELEALGRELGFQVTVVPPLSVLEAPVSSTRIRRALADGDVALAATLLGYPYTLQGTVIPGDHRGAQLGFPTANLEATTGGKVFPGRGVYAVETTARGRTYGGMMNIGIRPTLTDGIRVTHEVHLFGFEGELYGETITVRFHERLRQERRFPSVGELLAQLNRDREAAQILLKNRSSIYSAS